MEVSQFYKGDKICILRSAFLGDWITILPFVNYLIENCNILAEDIFFIIMNKEGINPAALILGKDSIYAKNTFILNSYKVSTLLNSAKQIKKGIPKFNKLVHLSFTQDNAISILKKKTLSFFLFGFKVQTFGFKLTKDEPLTESQYISYFDKLNINYNTKGINLSNFLAPESYTKLAREGAEKIIAIYAHSKLKMKIWPIQNFAEVMESLNSAYKISFYLIGSKEDYDYNETLIKHLGNKSFNINNIAGVNNINETIAFLNNIDLLIANDGAPIHFAALVNTPSVCIFTFKEPIGAWEPFINKNYITIRTEVSCKLCFKESCSNNICIKSVKTIDVINASHELLNNTDDISSARIFIPKYTLNYKTKHGG